jgi:hypothetical protein
VPDHSPRSAGSADPMAEISRVARPSADEADGTVALAAANDGCVVTIELVSVPLRISGRDAGIARPFRSSELVVSVIGCV